MIPVTVRHSPLMTPVGEDVAWGLDIAVGANIWFRYGIAHFIVGNRLLLQAKYTTLVLWFFGYFGTFSKLPQVYAFGYLVIFLIFLSFYQFLSLVPGEMA